MIRVAIEGPGAAVGLEPGDVITSLGGSPVTGLHRLHEVLARHRVKETVGLSVWREGRTITLRPVLGEEP